MNTMLQEHGVFNLMLEELFGVGPLPFLTNATWARVTVVIINLWIDIPFTLVSVTGALNRIVRQMGYSCLTIDYRPSPMSVKEKFSRMSRSGHWWILLWVRSFQQSVILRAKISNGKSSYP